jgi:hypothetical protein
MNRICTVLPLAFSLACWDGDPEPEDSSSSETPLPESTQRILMHEMFTGSTCGPCFEADAIVVDVLDANPGEYNLISYQVGSDPYVSGEGVSRRMYYLPGESSYSIPYLHVDGVHQLHPVEYNNDAGYTQADFDEFQAEPAWMELSVHHTQSEQTVEFSVEILPLSDVDADDMVLHAAIIEGVTYDNVGTNGQTEFHHVMKKMVPDEEGTALEPLVRGETVTLDLSYTFQGEYTSETGFSDPVDHEVEHTVEEFEDLSVIVWIQEVESWQVHQSAWSGSHD